MTLCLGEKENHHGNGREHDDRECPPHPVVVNRWPGVVLVAESNDEIDHPVRKDGKTPSQTAYAIWHEFGYGGQRDRPPSQGVADDHDDNTHNSKIAKLGRIAGKVFVDGIVDSADVAHDSCRVTDKVAVAYVVIDIEVDAQYETAQR